MKFHFVLALAFSHLVGTGFAAPDQNATMAIINSVNKRVMAGDAKALDDLKPLSRNDSIGSLLLFFKQNYYVMKATPSRRRLLHGP